MKIKLDIDCTPEEARVFFGLPDLTPLHAVMLEKMKAKVEEGVTSEDVETMMKLWLTGANSSMEHWQKLFMSGMSNK